MKKIFAFAEAYSLPLLLGIGIALFWANLAPDSYHHFVEFSLFGNVTIHFLVKEVFMALFFGVAMAEIVEALRPGGALHPLPKAVNPLLATAGGVLGPVLVFFLLLWVFDGFDYANGWGIVTATDIAIAWLGAKLIFGADHPGVKYLLLLAVADDAVGLVIIGIFYPAATVELSYLALCVLGMIIAYVLRSMHTVHHGFYLLLAGIPCWLGLYLAHLEPALALVLVVPFLPSVHRKELMVSAGAVPADTAHFALESFYRSWKPVVDYGLFFFGLVNAGVLLSSVAPVTWYIVAALLVGKTVGISLFGLLGGKLGFPLPQGMTGRDLFLVSIVAGVGLTVSLFMCDAAFAGEDALGAAKMGALLSISAVPLGYLISRSIVKTKKIKEEKRRCRRWILQIL